MSLAFVFPGQGSQAVGMVTAFADQPVVKETFDEASESLSLDLWAMCQDGPVEELNRTVNAQPALLTAGVAIWRLWCTHTNRLPEWMAGHSLGEYSALVCANALSLAEAVVLVRQRGKYMQMAVADGEGAMAAVLGLSNQQVSEICNHLVKDSYVQPANINSPQQTVVSGYKQAVEQFADKAKQLGAKRVIFLPVSVPSHCALMQSAADLLTGDLEALSLKIPQINILHNVDAQPAESLEVLKTKLIQQLVRAVQWVDTIRTMKQQGIKQIVECGPGRVLTGLNKAIDKELELFNPSQGMAALEQTINEIH